jgi:hypothetical protein
MRMLILASFISAAYAHHMPGHYSLDIGEESCPKSISISRSDKEVNIIRVYSNSKQEHEKYSQSEVFKTSRKMSTEIKLTAKKITVETFYNHLVGRAELLTHKSYTVSPEVMRHSLVYQESDIAQMHFIRCLYIKK